MKTLLMSAVAVLLVGCGGSSGNQSGGGGVVTVPAVSPTDMSRYQTSHPLADNSNSSEYKVLLMGNSHAAGVRPFLKQLLVLGQTNKSITVQTAPGGSFLAERVNDGVSEQTLESEQWTHVILQAQKYSSTGANTYPTTAAEYWIRGSKLLGATPVMFPEHPRRNNDWEGQTLWDLHNGIAARENACVAPVGLVWDAVIFREPALTLHQADGNHVSDTGALLTALVFYQIITGEPVESLPALSNFGIDSTTEQVLKDSVSSLLFTHASCAYEL
jgi:hypothetical protein